MCLELGSCRFAVAMRLRGARLVSTDHEKWFSSCGALANNWRTGEPERTCNRWPRATPTAIRGIPVMQGTSFAVQISAAAAGPLPLAFSEALFGKFEPALAALAGYGPARAGRRAPLARAARRARRLECRLTERRRERLIDDARTTWQTTSPRGAFRMEHYDLPDLKTDERGISEAIPAPGPLRGSRTRPGTSFRCSRRSSPFEPDRVRQGAALVGESIAPASGSRTATWGSASCRPASSSRGTRRARSSSPAT